MPGSVFCITDQQWLIALEAKKESPGVSIACATYTDTLLVGLTDVLLYGQLRIDYASVGRSESSECLFNTVYEEIYRKAIQQVLGLIDGIKEPATERDQKVKRYLENWPHKFRNLG